MSVPYRLANAPCSWGVDFSDRPENPPWQRVLDEVAASGFTGVDLGPVGYFPADPSRLSDELARRGLVLSAGGLFDPLADPAAFPGVLEKTRRTCEILRRLNAPRLVIIDCVSPDREQTAGRPDASVRLTPATWNSMMERIITIARVAREEYGVTSTLHAHAGCHIEYEDEIDRAMADLPEDLVGLCVDTGHSAYAGIDPIKLLRRYAARVGHVHFKNISAVVYRDCIAAGTDFFHAIARGVFCPLGQGVVKFEAVRDVLADIGYTGMAVVEQDVDPTGNASPLANARESYQFLRSIGMAPAARVQG